MALCNIKEQMACKNVFPMTLIIEDSVNPQSLIQKAGRIIPIVSDQKASQNHYAGLCKQNDISIRRGSYLCVRKNVRPFVLVVWLVVYFGCKFS